MTIDLDDIESRINDGIYGDDRMSDTARDDAFSALAEIIAEVTRLRADVAAERSAVVAFLRGLFAAANLPLGLDRVFATIVDNIADGEHRREGDE
jgi:hypothetical protein